MNKSILKLLSAAALIAATAAPAFADTAHGADVDVWFSGFNLVSSSGNSFTFSSGPYVEDGIPNHTLFKNAFDLTAHDGKVLTGKLSFTMDVQYQLEAPPGPWPYDGGYSAYSRASFDVLVPHCDTCGPYDAELIGNAQGSASSATTTTPTNGTLSFSSNASEANGSYDRLIAFMFYALDPNPAYGSMTITSLTMSIDTAPAVSPVPELPPFAMMGAGLAVLALRARRNSRKQQAKAALEA